LPHHYVPIILNSIPLLCRKKTAIFNYTFHFKIQFLIYNQGIKTNVLIGDDFIEIDLK